MPHLPCVFLVQAGTSPSRIAVELLWILVSPFLMGFASQALQLGLLHADTGPGSAGHHAAALAIHGLKPTGHGETTPSFLTHCAVPEQQLVLRGLLPWLQNSAAEQRALLQQALEQQQEAVAQGEALGSEQLAGLEQLQQRVGHAQRWLRRAEGFRRLGLECELGVISLYHLVTTTVDSRVLVGPPGRLVPGGPKASAHRSLFFIPSTLSPWPNGYC